MAKRVVVLVVMAVVVAGCTTAADETTTSVTPTTEATATTESTSATTTSMPPETTTTEAPTTTATTTTTTTEAPPTTGSTEGPFTTDEPLSLAPPEPLPGSAGASGSGCTPGAGPLPDGIWFGFAPAIGASTLDLDLACFYFGDIAYDEGDADGEEVNNDYYIRNQNPAIRTVPVAGDTVVWTLGTFDGIGEHSSVAYADWPAPGPAYIECPGDFCLLWLYVNDGTVTEIVEQYVP